MVFTPTRRSLKNCSSFIIVALFRGIGSFEPLSAETLKEAIATAYQTNATLASAQAGTKATSELLAQAAAGWLPTAQVIGSVDQEHKDTAHSSLAFNSGHNRREGTKAGLEIAQNIYSGGATEATAQMRQAEVQAAVAGYRKTEQDLLLAVIKAYLEVLKSQAILDQTNKHLTHLKRELEQGKARLELQDITLTDLAQIEAELARAQSDRIKAEGDLESAQAQYVGLVGKMPDLLTFPETPLFLPKDKQEAFEIALTQNPDYIKSQFEERSTKNNVEIALAAMRPSVDVKLALTRNENNDSFTKKSRVYDGVATASVKVPLDISGDAQSKVRRARLEASQKRLTRKATRDQLSTSVSQKMDAVTTTTSQIGRFEELVKFKNIAREGMTLEEEIGARTINERLKAEDEYYEAEVELIDARVKALTSHFELLVEMGDLTLARLDVPITPYNPDSYINEVSGAPYNLSVEDEALSSQNTSDTVEKNKDQEEEKKITEELEKI